MNVEPIDILLIEDSEEDAELALRALRKRNLANRVRHLRDGAAALEYLYANDSGLVPNPKLILLDLKLPKVDGMEVLRRIKGDERTRHIPVVMLTSSREERDLVQSYRLGVNSYITKPIDFESFVQAVSDVGFYWLLVNTPPR